MAPLSPRPVRSACRRGGWWVVPSRAVLTLLLAAPLRAETGAQRFLADTLDTRAGWDLEVDAGFDASAAASSAGAVTRSLSQQSGSVSAVRSFGLGPGLALDGGVRGSFVDLGGGPAVGLPAHLESDGLVLGASWKPATEWGISFQALPAFSGEPGSLSSRTLNVSGALSGLWLINERLLVQAGVEFDSLGRYTLYPEGGVIYDLTAALSLRLLFPQPRMVYQMTPAWAVYAGADVEVVSDRVGPTFGSSRGVPRLNNAVLSLEETEFGPGTSYRWGEAVYLEVNFGWVTERKDDYFRAAKSLTLRPAAALRLSVEMTF